MLKYGSFRSTIKYEIAPLAPKLLWKELYFFSPSMKTSGENIKFDDKKVKNKEVFTKTKK